MWLPLPVSLSGALASVALVLAMALLLSLCVCQRFKVEKGPDDGSLGERLSNHQVNCQLADGTVLPVYGPKTSLGSKIQSTAARRRDSAKAFLGLSARRKSRNSTIERALPEIPKAMLDGEAEADSNYDLILKPENESSGPTTTQPPSRDPIYSSVRGEDLSLSEGMYAKVPDSRNGGLTLTTSSTRPGAMALEINGRLAGQPPFGIREHEYSRIKMDDENLYFKVGSESGSESGYAHVHARESSIKRAKGISGLALEGVVVTGDEMYAEIKKTSNPDSGDTDVEMAGVGVAFDPTTLENLYAFPPPVPEKQFDLNDSYDPEHLQTVHSIPFIDEAGFASPTSPDLPPRNSVGAFSFPTGGAITPPPSGGNLSIFSHSSSSSTSINHNKTPSLTSAASSSSTVVNGSLGAGSLHPNVNSVQVFSTPHSYSLSSNTPNDVSCIRYSPHAVNDANHGHSPHIPNEYLVNISQHSPIQDETPLLFVRNSPHNSNDPLILPNSTQATNELFPTIHHSFEVPPETALDPSLHSNDDKKEYVIVTARESVPVLQARRAQEAKAKELAEKKRRHVYQNVNGGSSTTCSAPTDDSDSENYAKVLDPNLNTATKKVNLNYHLMFQSPS